MLVTWALFLEAFLLVRFKVWISSNNDSRNTTSTSSNGINNMNKKSTNNNDTLRSFSPFGFRLGTAPTL